MDLANSEYLYQCHASYFNPVSCKWQDGTFTLQRNYFEFTAVAPEQETPFHLFVPFQMISAIKKRNACLIYASLVIEVGSESHWFSSFASRDSVYNLIELFHRNLLLSLPRSSSISKTLESKTVSPLGRKLLGILHESEETLNSTANLLDQQGQQLQEAQQDMEELNSDLTKAKKILHNLPLLPPAHGILPELVSSTKVESSVNKEKKKKYKVTFTSHENSTENSNEWERGFLLLADGIKLLDQEENVRFHIPSKELLSIMIVSPWELCVEHECCNKANSYNVMCPLLSQLHKVICSNPELKDKIFYKEECENAFRNNISFSSASSESGSISSPSRCETETLTQVQEYTESLTDEELNEISKALGNLQTLATEVNKERECQLEKIKTLIDDVDNTDVRISKSSKVMKKLM